MVSHHPCPGEGVFSADGCKRKYEILAATADATLKNRLLNFVAQPPLECLTESAESAFAKNYLISAKTCLTFLGKILSTHI
jgi:hypothetical protein